MEPKLFLEFVQVLVINYFKIIGRGLYFSSVSVKYSVDMNLGILIIFHFELSASGYSSDNHRASRLLVLKGVLAASARLLLGQRLFAFCLAIPCSLLGRHLHLGN